MTESSLRQALVTLLLLAAAPAVSGQHPKHGAAPQVEYLAAEDAATRNLPFSEAVRVGNLLYLSGMIGNRPGTLELAPGGIRAETKQTLENIRAVLEKHGASLDNVFKCTVMLADIAEWPAMNEVYVTYFDEDRRPARSAFGSSGLALGARVEIECLAAVH